MMLFSKWALLIFIVSFVGQGFSFLKNQWEAKSSIDLAKVKEVSESIHKIVKAHRFHRKEQRSKEQGQVEQIKRVFRAVNEYSRKALVPRPKRATRERRGKISSKGTQVEEKIRRTTAHAHRVATHVSRRISNRDEKGAAPRGKRLPKKPLQWMTTQALPSQHDLSDKLYAQKELGKVDIQLEKIDHSRLLASYLHVISTLEEKDMPVLLATQPSGRERREEGREGPVGPRVAVQVEQVEQVEKDEVSQTMAKSEELEELIVFDYSQGPKSPEAKREIKGNHALGGEAAGGPGRYNPFLLETYGERSIPDYERLVGAEGVRKIFKEATKKVAKRAEGGEKVDTFPPRREEGASEIVVRAQVFSFSGGPGKEYSHFEVRPDYSDDERWSDEGSGQVSIQKELNSKMGIVLASMHGADIIDTKIELAFERGVRKEISVPVFLRDDFEAFSAMKSFSGGGGFLFVELDDSTESVHLDVEYEGVLFLDRELKRVGQSGDHRYILFVGVSPGSATIDYVRNGHENLKKVVLIERDGLYYDSNEYVGVGEDVVDIEQKNVFGHSQSDLEIRGRDISQFNSYERASEIGPGRYDLGIKALPIGTRKYIELAHLSSPIYLGRWDAKKIVVPSEDYISYFLEAVGLADLSGVCLIQVNFRDGVKALNITGGDGESSIPVDQIFIDNDGRFSEEISPRAIQGFFTSDQFGVVSLRVEYENGKEDYLNSYCSSSTYIIEQL